MWWLADPHDLHRVSDRVSTVYVERCHIDRAENAVVFVNRERAVRVPAAFIGAVLIGPGTRVTHAAIRLLGDSGTSVCWVGEHGVRMYAAGLGPSRGAQLAQRQAHLVSHRQDRLAVARAMYAIRFPGEDVSEATMQQLRGREGARVKRIYREHAKRTNVTWKGRQYRPGDAFAAGDDLNRLLSAANSCLYGACHAAVVGVGAIPALGFVHTGGAMSFVLDVADLYKADFSIPLAFDLAAAGRLDESDARHAMRERFADGQFMQRVVRDVRRLIMGGDDPDNDPEDRNFLWDEQGKLVAGGTNWSDENVLDELLDTGHVVISGPELPEVEDRP